jgi:hypothetical protein
MKRLHHIIEEKRPDLLTPINDLGRTIELNPARPAKPDQPTELIPLITPVEITPTEVAPQPESSTVIAAEATVYDYTSKPDTTQPDKDRFSRRHLLFSQLRRLRPRKPQE